MMHFTLGFGIFKLVLPLAVFAAGTYGFALLSFRSKRKSLLQAHRSLQEQSEVEIYRLAKEKGGIITISDIIVSMNISRFDAEKIMKTVCDEIHVQMQIMDTGRISYIFPEIRNEP